MKKYYFTILLFFLGLFSYSQLANFQLNVTGTDESCTGNGSLNFSVTNATSGSTIIYSIYLLPNITNPIAVMSENSLSGLTAGTYRVVALQSLGNLSNSQQSDYTIQDIRIPIIYQVSSEPMTCYSESGTITVNVLQGNPATYEIISGPIIFPPQASNVFNNLVVGTYDIRVNDQCGDGIVQTHTIEQIFLSNLIVSVIEPTVEELCVLASCDSRTINAQVECLPGTIIHYPLQVEVKVFHPSNPPVTVTQTITSGSPSLLSLSIDIPFYNVSSYSFIIKVIGPCGEISESQSEVLEAPSDFSFVADGGQCHNALYINNMCNLLPPYTLNFISAPPGFDPALFNPNNLGPFSNGVIAYTYNGTQEIPVGEYVVELTDGCGRTLQQTTTVSPLDTGFSLLELGCGQVQFSIGNIVSLIFVEAPPSFSLTLPLDLTDSLVNGTYTTVLLPGDYVITGLNGCGGQFSISFNVPESELLLNVETANLPGCSGNYGQIEIGANNLLESVIMIQAPAAYSTPLPHDVSEFIEVAQFKMYFLPAGEYVFEFLDVCGHTIQETVVVPLIVSYEPLILYPGHGCGPNFDSVAYTSPNGPITEFVITAAPSNFPFPLPYDVSFNIASNGFFCMNSFPVGTYVFHSVDNCNVVRDETVTLVGLQATEDIQILPNCGSFDLDLQYPNNSELPVSFWLQKYNAITNQWVHPLSGAVYTEGSLPDGSNSYGLNNLSINYNIASLGEFRILMSYRIYQNGAYASQPCVDVIKTFEFTGSLDIDSSYTITCNAGLLDVIILATGIAPFTYKITAKNGVPFFVDNGSSNLFVGLEPAIYNFQILDSCGNILNKLIDLTALSEPTIASNNLCDGLIGQLSVPPISFLSYQWWKGNDTSTILSTSNTLTFSPFSSITTPGTYYVRIYSTTPISCIDKIYSFVVTAVSNPSAGNDGALSLCGTSNPIDLFSLLSGTFDTNGTWQELTNSGALSGNNWTPNGLPFGDYLFQYSVSGLCNSSDEALVTIHLNAPPPTPEITGETSFCIGETLNLQVNSIPNATYQWLGPNNFTSNNQSISIDNIGEFNAGSYTISVFLNGCESESSIEVVVNPNPDFTFEEMCMGTNYTVKVIPVENSFNLSDVNFSWTGPNGFTSTQNQIIVSNQDIGNYTVSVTNSNNCSASKSIDIENVMCEFSNIITPNNDGSNDSFDLSGFEVDKFEIYSRWGRLVYEEYNYIDSWYGQNMKNEPLPNSTYYYIISFHSGEQKHGWIFLAR